MVFRFRSMGFAVLLGWVGFTAEKRRKEVEERCGASLRARTQRDFRQGENRLRRAKLILVRMFFQSTIICQLSSLFKVRGTKLEVRGFLRANPILVRMFFKSTIICQLSTLFELNQTSWLRKRSSKVSRRRMRRDWPFSKRTSAGL